MKKVRDGPELELFSLPYSEGSCLLLKLHDADLFLICNQKVLGKLSVILI